MCRASNLPFSPHAFLNPRPQGDEVFPTGPSLDPGNLRHLHRCTELPAIEECEGMTTMTMMRSMQKNMRMEMSSAMEMAIMATMMVVVTMILILTMMVMMITMMRMTGSGWLCLRLSECLIERTSECMSADPPKLPLEEQRCARQAAAVAESSLRAV